MPPPDVLHYLCASSADMKLFIYNPEHDISLARNTADTLIPRPARRARSLFDHVPAYLAGDGDIVVVEDVKNAERRLKADGREHARVKLLTLDDVSRLSEECLPDAVVPWGWDKSIVKILTNANPLLVRLMPSDDRLNDIRRMSSRVFTARELLPRLMYGHPERVGRMYVYDGEAESLARKAEEGKRFVIKAPWSNAGRGVMFVRSALTDNDLRRVGNILREQGSVIVEPLYDKLLDFAMEFEVNENGETEYRGLSLFETRNGRYVRNIIASETEKRRIIERYIPADAIDEAANDIIKITSELLTSPPPGCDELRKQAFIRPARAFRNRYTGPFGTDMMVVKCGGANALHPCVELNLRYTMGHVAL